MTNYHYLIFSYELKLKEQTLGVTGMTITHCSTSDKNFYCFLNSTNKAEFFNTGEAGKEE